MKHVIKLFALITAVFFLGFFMEEFFEELPMGINEESIDILSDFFPVFVSFSIFALTWFAYGKSRDNHSLFMGGVFFVIGLIDLMHLLSYPFLPDFITPNSFQKAGILHNEARLFSGILFLASAYVYKDTLPKFINKPVLLASASLLFLISIVPALFYPEILPALSRGSTISPALLYRQTITSLLILCASYLYARRLQNSGEKHLMFLIDGFIVLVFSDLVYFNYEIPGHLLKLAGFIFIHRALYQSSVEQPYDKLAEAEDRLRMAAEERYRNLFDNASDAIVTVDLEESITSWNQAAEKIFGWNSDQVIGKKLANILVPKDNKIEKNKIIECVLSGKAASGIDVVCPHKNGTDVNVSLSVSPIMDANHNIMGLSGIMRDITDRKRAEEELLKFRLGIEKSVDAIFITDTNGMMLYVNPAFEKIYGYSREESLGKTPRILKSGLAPQEVYRQFWDTILAKKVVTGELINKTKDGRFLNIEGSANPILNEDGNIIGFLALQRDITERKRAEKLIKESEERYRNIVELTTDIIYVLDREGNQVFINDAGYRILEASPEEIIGKPWLTWIHPDDRERTFKKFIEMVEQGIDVFDFENRYLSKGGRVVHVVHNIRVLRNEKGNVIGTQGIARDMTEIKKAEEVRMENMRLAIASSAKSEFLANMSHELRTPLNSIIGFSELLQQNSHGELNEKQNKYVGNVLTSGKFLLNLINDILDLSKVEAGKIEPVFEKVPVHAVINETLTLIKEKASKHNVLINKEFDPALNFIKADQQRFKQILFNLLSNAVKFSKKEGGTVTVRTKKDGNMARISVSDTGIGIREEDMGKLFKEFEQLDPGISRKYGGTGLGLAISKKLVELHGGKIWAESRYGEGAIFAFTLPIDTYKGDMFEK